MFEVKITLDATARLESAVYRLAEALSGSQIIEAVAPAAPVVPAANVPATPAPATAPAPAPAPAAPAPVPAPAVPIAQPAAAPAPVAQPAPAPAAVPVARTAAPTYTKEQVATAGAALIQSNEAKKAELQALLAQFGVPYIGALPDEHLGAFATALRGLGANI